MTKSSVLLGADEAPMIDTATVKKELETAKPAPPLYDAAGDLIVGQHDGVIQTVHFDEADDTFTYNWSTDAEPIIESNKRLQADNFTGMTKDKSLKHVAHIDHVTAKIWETQYGLNWKLIGKDPAEDRKLSALLNDPDWRYCRTGGGRV